MIKPVNLKEVEQTSDHFTEMLEAIQNNKYQDSHLQGLRDCRCLFENWIAQLHKENSKLKAELKQKDEKLSEFIEGLPIENANKRKRYQYNCLGDILIVRWHEPSNCWLYYCEEDESDKEFIETHVFTLPSTETQMEGE